MRDVDLALGAKKIFFANNFELLQFEGVGLEINFGAEAVDLAFKKRKRAPGSGEITAKFSLTGVERSFNGNRSRKIAWLGAEEFRELPQVADVPQNLAAKIGIEPIG